MNRSLCGLNQCLFKKKKKSFIFNYTILPFPDGRLQLLYSLHFPIIFSNSVHVFDPLITQKQIENSQR